MSHSSRLRENPSALFEVFVEVAAPVKDRGAVVRWKYPEYYASDEEPSSGEAEKVIEKQRQKKMLKSTIEFIFPCEMSSDAVQLFSIVLTDADSRHTFGFCRHTPRSSTCLCILSSLPWFELFYKLLNHLADVRIKKSAREVEAIVANALRQPVPAPSELFTVESSLGKDKMECICPDHTRLPRIPDNRNLTEYFNAADEENMIRVFASLICERRVIFVSRKLSQLSSCVIAAEALIFPMHWQYIFVPVLPPHLINMLGAPMPYLIGVPSLELVPRDVNLNDDVVVFDIDSQHFHSPFNDYEELPPEVMSVLRKNLRHSNHLIGDGVARAFLRALVALIGGYREGLQFPGAGEEIRFNADAFLRSRPPSMQPYLERLVHVQIFQQFIEERLAQFNAGAAISDEFEDECRLFAGGEKEFSRFKYQYAEWLTNAKKESKDLFKHIGKVRSKGKEAFKDMRSRFSDWKDDVPRPEKTSGPFSPPLPEGVFSPSNSSAPRRRKAKGTKSTSAKFVSVDSPSVDVADEAFAEEAMERLRVGDEGVRENSSDVSLYGEIAAEMDARRRAQEKGNVNNTLRTSKSLELLVSFDEPLAATPSPLPPALTDGALLGPTSLFDPLFATTASSNSSIGSSVASRDAPPVFVLGGKAATPPPRPMRPPPPSSSSVYRSSASSIHASRSVGDFGGAFSPPRPVVPPRPRSRATGGDLLIDFGPSAPVVANGGKDALADMIFDPLLEKTPR